MISPNFLFSNILLQPAIWDEGNGEMYHDLFEIIYPVVVYHYLFGEKMGVVRQNLLKLSHLKEKCILLTYLYYLFHLFFKRGDNCTIYLKLGS